MSDPGDGEQALRARLAANPNDLGALTRFLGLAGAAGDKAAETAILRQLVTVAGSPVHKLALAENLAAAGEGDTAMMLFRQAAQEFHLMARAGAANTMPGALLRLTERGFAPTGILDIGAYHGDWARMARLYFPAIPLVMIEAQPDLETRLAAVAADIAPARVVSAVLGAADGDPVAFHIHEFMNETTGAALLPMIGSAGAESAARTVTLPLRTIDAVLDGDPVRYALWKMDIQGAELEAIRGAPRRLRDAEVIIAEVALDPYCQPGAPLFLDVATVMDGLGFDLDDIADLHRSEGGPRVGQCDAVFVRRESPLRRSV